MGDFVFVTHTSWQEAPRIRHQLARLIANAGHRVIFLERAEGPWSAISIGGQEMETRIVVAQTKRLLHHQLRVATALDWANSIIVKSSIRQQLDRIGVSNHATVINFTHDYHFLRDLLPESEVITIISDDFEGQARLPWFGHVTNNLQRTCSASNRVLALSTPLVNRLRKWCNAELFLPWSLIPYRDPGVDLTRRNSLLYWGFIDIGLDTDCIRQASVELTQQRPGWKLLVVGPTQVAARRKWTAEKLTGLPNVSVLGACELSDLPMADVLAAFIPYRRKPDADAIELPNKALQMMAYGLPIIKSGMPHMLREPFILPIDEGESINTAVDNCIKSFHAWQPLIKQFMAKHTADARLQQLGIEPVN